MAQELASDLPTALGIVAHFFPWVVMGLDENYQLPLE